ncbi:LysR family transcriptional regulator [Agaricicola taiwanensis]|uniref:LysR family transcriptional regulator n=1 Tax=Agaricicola taiwanensis TaxID=591372 RepID=A0A8J2YG74_9RHOB|nr:LysR family transcriptional regulator [Agaricicola taiwanensis]GGE34070.1 LysR family transcriptional regulator [Agaricicola taiwanensis]
MNHLGDMEVFARVVATSSMSAAAREMGLSPAVVSKRIRRMEERLGVRLLQRTTRQIALTDVGEGYYERALAILASIDEAEAFASGRAASAQGVLKVSAPTSFGRLHVAPHLTPFLEANPGLTVHLDLSDALVDIVGDGFDLALRIADLGDSSFVARRLAPVHRVLCATPDYLARHGEPRTIHELSRHRLLAALSQDPWKLEGPEGPVTLKTQGPLRTNSNEVVREAVLSSMGIALRSTWDVGAELRSGKLRAVLPSWRASSRIGVHAVYPTRRFLAQKVRIFIDYLAGLYGATPYWDEGLDIVERSSDAA